MIAHDEAESPWQYLCEHKITTARGGKLKMECPPFQAISELVHDGAVVFFLGAGASACGRPQGHTYKEGMADFPPLGSELAELLAYKVAFPTDDQHDRQDLGLVSSYYEHVAMDRSGLVDRLRTIFNPRFRPGRVHEYVAGVQAPILIITTNYDDLIEQAFQARKRPFHLVVHPNDQKAWAGAVLWRPADKEEFEPHEPNKLPLSLTDTSIIYKMHGSIDPQRRGADNFVVTEEDYVDFIGGMTRPKGVLPPAFAMTLRNSRFLFLGYGLRDWNFRVMLRNIRNGHYTKKVRAAGGAFGSSHETLRSWAVQRGPSDIERQIWAAHKVTIFDLDLNEFIARLECPGP